ncbi:UNVERIFIED_CONTAM: hypothetical protein K2H54_047442 [Gekko kuhli]
MLGSRRNQGQDSIGIRDHRVDCFHMGINSPKILHRAIIRILGVWGRLRRSQGLEGNNDWWLMLGKTWGVGFGPDGQPSFENEQKFRRLPAHRFPVYSIKRKLGADVRSPDRTLEGQKESKVRRSAAYGPIATLRERTAPPAGQVPEGPAAEPCVTTSRPEPCIDARVLHPSCPHRCPLRKPLLDPTLTVSQLQQMRPSVITCAPRRSCSETPTATRHPVSPTKQSNEETPSSSHSQRFCAWTPGSAQPSGRASPQQSSQETEDHNPYPATDYLCMLFTGKSPSASL